MLPAGRVIEKKHSNRYRSMTHLECKHSCRGAEEEDDEEEEEEEIQRRWSACSQ
jgi:hypothetical protein